MEVWIVRWEHHRTQQVIFHCYVWWPEGKWRFVPPFDAILIRPQHSGWKKQAPALLASGSRSTNTAVVTATKTRTEPKWQENVGSFTGTQEKKKKRLIHMRWVGHFQVCKWSLAIGVARLKPKSHMYVKTGRTSITSKKLWLWWT
jgi:hypothetical protein